MEEKLDRVKNWEKEPIWKKSWTGGRRTGQGEELERRTELEEELDWRKNWTGRRTVLEEELGWWKNWIGGRRTAHVVKKEALMKKALQSRMK